MVSYRVALFFWGFLALQLTSCGGSSSLTMNLKNLSSGTVSSRSAAETELKSVLKVDEWLRAAGEFGAAAVGSTGLSSFKLYIKEIRICESLETSLGSTAYNNPKGCASIYTNAADNYDTFDVTAAASAGTGKYFDILSATDRASLTKVTEAKAGTYNVGIIDWYRPVKVTADITLGNSNHIYTKACAAGTGCTVTGMQSAPAAESIVDLNNGGTWFRMLKPFTVTAGTPVNIDLAFDLEQHLFGGDSVSNGAITQVSGCSSVASGYCGMFVPILRLSPVPRLSTESTMVEVYEMTPSDSTQWKLRVDVFYNSADSAKSVLAADVFTIPTATTATNITAGVYVYDVALSGTTTTFKGYDGSSQLVFTRGDSGSGAVLTCPTGGGLPGCTSTTTLSWTSRAIRTL